MLEKEEFYAELQRDMQALLQGETNRIAMLANASALLNSRLDDINWVGFYLQENGRLVVGPFQGLPACSGIPIGKGVCGTAFAQQKTLRVDDVHQFDGHIACDSRSRSEIVIPLVVKGEYWGVLDIDSPSLGRFGVEDQLGLEKIVIDLGLLLGAHA